MKAVSLLVRKPDISRAAFRAYYERHYCLLAMQHFPFRRYVRNHLLENDDRFGFDCISEFGLAEEFRRVPLMGSRSRQLMEADELEFMQPELIRVAAAEEHILFAADSHGPSQQRQVLLFRDEGPGPGPQGLKQGIETLGAELLRQLDSVSEMKLDLLTSDPAQPFPFDALLWIRTEGTDGFPLKPGTIPGLVGSLAVMTCASSEDELKERFVRFQP
ncbi:EthD domain-containing protein [Pseudomonas sp. OIL-1]|uniref:EthD domain-containing protein n=1 Tax=Pseudomonas sp. OIL-1 TaxID=2706126 RepID=UPI0013A70DA6|nr:EthD domain-containing protein [Pseudomonas sp. OIL-1]QIB51539.1 EthD domain-containing protein [Pseudomonas sp. OIL-1]